MTADRYETFAALHRPGDPVVLFNIWDAGSAVAVVGAGARAVATGSASVAGALGRRDGEGLPLDWALENARRIVEAVEVPVTLDFEGGYAVEAEALRANAARVRETGVVGLNFEDQVVGGEGLHAPEVQAARIAAIRAGAGERFWINARTDLFLKAAPKDHDEDLVAAALDRAARYADAGGDSLFVPGLRDPGLIARVCERSPLPVNVMVFPGMATRAELAALGVARISHGPFPWRAAMAGLTEAARQAME